MYLDPVIPERLRLFMPYWKEKLKRIWMDRRIYSGNEKRVTDLEVGTIKGYTFGEMLKDARKNHVSRSKK